MLYLKELQQNEVLVNYNFYCLWPFNIKEDNPWELLIVQFYNSLLSSQYPLFYSSVTKTWNKLDQSYFLSHNILSIGFEEILYPSMLEVISILEISLVTISKEIWDKLNVNDKFENRVIKEEDFLKLFYQDDVLVKIPVNIKNTIVTASLVVFANNKHNKVLPELMKVTKLIVFLVVLMVKCLKSPKTFWILIQKFPSYFYLVIICAQRKLFSNKVFFVIRLF